MALLLAGQSIQFWIVSSILVGIMGIIVALLATFVFKMKWYSMRTLYGLVISFAGMLLWVACGTGVIVDNTSFWILMVCAFFVSATGISISNSKMPYRKVLFVSTCFTGVFTFIATFGMSIFFPDSIVANIGNRAGLYSLTGNMDYSRTYAVTMPGEAQEAVGWLVMISYFMIISYAQLLPIFFLLVMLVSVYAKGLNAASVGVVVTTLLCIMLWGVGFQLVELFKPDYFAAVF